MIRLPTISFLDPTTGRLIALGVVWASVLAWTAYLGGLLFETFAFLPLWSASPMAVADWFSDPRSLAVDSYLGWEGWVMLNAALAASTAGWIASWRGAGREWLWLGAIGAVLIDVMMTGAPSAVLVIVSALLIIGGGVRWRRSPRCRWVWWLSGAALCAFLLGVITVTFLARIQGVLHTAPRQSVADIAAAIDAYVVTNWVRLGLATLGYILTICGLVRLFYPSAVEEIEPALSSDRATMPAITAMERDL